MLFDEYLVKYKSEIKIAVKELLTKAIKNQTHEGDLFLINLHGFFQKEIEEAKVSNPSLNLSPYVFGPGHEAYEEDQASNRFYFRLRSNINNGDRAKFYEYKKTDNSWEDERNMIVQLEMYMYLKFWESDMILKKLTQLTRLANKEYYKWELSFKSTSARGEFIRNKIIEKIRTICPSFHALINQLYDQQLRNAIAHSQYYFMGDNLILSNQGVNEISNRRLYTIDEWDILMNKFVLFYDFLNYSLIVVEKYYQRQVVDKHFGQPVRVIRKGDIKNAKIEWIKWMDEHHRWIWYKTWADHYRPNFFIV